MRRRRLDRPPPAARLLGVLAVTTMLLGGFGVWAMAAASALRSAAASANTALADGAATAPVQRSVASAVQSV